MNFPFNIKEWLYKLVVRPLWLKWSFFVAPELSKVESPCSCTILWPISFPLRTFTPDRFSFSIIALRENLILQGGWAGWETSCEDWKRLSESLAVRNDPCERLLCRWVMGAGLFRSDSASFWMPAWGLVTGSARWCEVRRLLLDLVQVCSAYLEEVGHQPMFWGHIGRAGFLCTAKHQRFLYCKVLPFEWPSKGCRNA